MSKSKKIKKHPYFNDELYLNGILSAFEMGYVVYVCSEYKDFLERNGYLFECQYKKEIRVLNDLIYGSYIYISPFKLNNASRIEKVANAYNKRIEEYNKKKENNKEDTV